MNDFYDTNLLNIDEYFKNEMRKMYQSFVDALLNEELVQCTIATTSVRKLINELVDLGFIEAITNDHMEYVSLIKEKKEYFKEYIFVRDNL